MRKPSCPPSHVPHRRAVPLPAARPFQHARAVAPAARHRDSTELSPDGSFSAPHLRFLPRHQHRPTIPSAPQTPATSPAHNTPSATDESGGPPQNYNLHAQYTFTGMTYPSFSAQYSNPAYLVYGTGSSLPTQGAGSRNAIGRWILRIPPVLQHGISLRCPGLAGLWPQQHLRHWRLP